MNRSKPNTVAADDVLLDTLGGPEPDNADLSDPLTAALLAWRRDLEPPEQNNPSELRR